MLLYAPLKNFIILFITTLIGLGGAPGTILYNQAIKKDNIALFFTAGFLTFLGQLLVAIAYSILVIIGFRYYFEIFSDIIHWPFWLFASFIALEPVNITAMLATEQEQNIQHKVAPAVFFFTSLAFIIIVIKPKFLDPLLTWIP
jgi:hypothetical protein